MPSLLAGGDALRLETALFFGGVVDGTFGCVGDVFLFTAAALRSCAVFVVRTGRIFLGSFGFGGVAVGRLRIAARLEGVVDTGAASYVASDAMESRAEET